MDKSCAECKFGSAFSDYDGVGICRRYPPTGSTPHPRGGVVPVWAAVRSHDWCGEFSPNPSVGGEDQ